METLLVYDRELFYRLNYGLNHPLLDPVMWLITSLGLGWVQALIVLTVVGGLAWRRRMAVQRLRTVLLPAVVALVGSGATAQVLKHLFPRLRPSTLPGALVAPDERIFYSSFPSGHTTTAFALAFWVFLLAHATRYRVWGYGALLLAGLIGLSRIYRGVHYPSDVLAGAFIGVLWGAMAYRLTLSLSRAPAPHDAESPPDSASACPRD
ncbi:MAG: phosphatase PAP2 family protein [Fimbriimonadales bacterium]|nr:phosphatase PAP2 family protein [Fimbriimonadales bacterium]MCS7190081.1 phosphatase PAP2 family protein [Fimbriimonadales bacterium]